MQGNKSKVCIDNRLDYDRQLFEAVIKADARKEAYLLVEDGDSIYEIDVKCYLKLKGLK